MTALGVDDSVHIPCLPEIKNLRVLPRSAKVLIIETKVDEIKVPEIKGTECKLLRTQTLLARNSNE